MQLDPSLLAAIKAEPDDDLLRLQAADWFEERGATERAEFIRIQIKTATFGDGIGRDHCHNYDASGKCQRCENGLLKRREEKLLDGNWGAWTEGMPESLVTKTCRRCEGGIPDYETGVTECRACDSTGIVADADNLEFRRGFIEQIRCSWPDWLIHAENILAQQPVRRVELTTWPEVAYKHPPTVDFNCPPDLKGQFALVASRDAVPHDMDYIIAASLSASIRQHLLPSMLASEWPGLAFRLPQTADQITERTLDYAASRPGSDLFHDTAP